MKHKHLLLTLGLWVILSAQLLAQVNYTGYFKLDYISARQVFRNNANLISSNYSDSKTFTINVESKVDDDLTVDLLYIPCQKQMDKLLIISSGVHGVEGFVGNAVQQMFMEKFINEDLLNNTGLLFVHSVNPYGFKYLRRVSENNVDLNRNSSTDTSLYSSVNEGYAKMYSFINPAGKVNTKSCKNKMFNLRAVFKIIRASMPVLRQAVLQGQYQYPEGLYFGGSNFEPQIVALTPIISSICEPYKSVFAIDLHTGYGEKGKLHLFPNTVGDVAKKQLEDIFAGYEIDWSDSDDFYTVTGDFVDFMNILNKDKAFLPMTFEYGTMNSQTTKGSLKSIHIMILENQGNHYGYKKERDSLKVINDFVEMYNPSSAEWRTKIMKDTEDMLKTIIPRFIDMDLN
jgi:hypothetical protein